jgi:hypothetical protein
MGEAVASHRTGLRGDGSPLPGTGVIRGLALARRKAAGVTATRHQKTKNSPNGGPSDMSDETSIDLQLLIDRLRRGDESARRELLLRAHDRLQRIAASIFREDFPALHGRHDLESVVSEVWMRLSGALEKTRPETVEGFFGLVFLKVRQVLLDMAQGQRRVDARTARRG